MCGEQESKQKAFNESQNQSQTNSAKSKRIILPMLRRCVCFYSFLFDFHVICSFRWLLLLLLLLMFLLLLPLYAIAGVLERYVKILAAISIALAAPFSMPYHRSDNNLLNACQKLVFTCVWSRFVPSRRTRRISCN